MGTTSVNPNHLLGLGILVALLHCGTLIEGYGAASTDRCPSSSFLPYTTSIVAHPYNNKCYQFVHRERYWAQARDYCRRYGGRLVTIPDASTNRFILRALNNLPWRNSGVWIGLHDRTDEMSWEWSTEVEGISDSVTWSNWGRGHPRASLHHLRDCVRMVRGGNTWRWHETPCALFNWRYRFICQYEMQPSMVARVISTRPTKSTTTTPRLTTTATPTFKYGVGEEFGASNLKDNLMKGPKSSFGTTVSPSEMVTTERDDVIGVVVPLQLQQNDGDGHTNMLGGIIVACLIMVFLSLLVIIVVYFRRRRQKKALSSSLKVANPTYCSATCGTTPMIVAANGQTTLLKTKTAPENHYTDEPSGGQVFIPAYSDDVAPASGEVAYQEMNSADENAHNAETEKQLGLGVDPEYADAYDVPKRPLMQLREKVPTPSGHYLPMNGSHQVASRRRLPTPSTDEYMEPVQRPASAACRTSNIYAEIPDEDEDDAYPLAENVYETLEDMEKNRRVVL